MKKERNVIVAYFVIILICCCCSKKVRDEENTIYYSDLKKVETIKFGDTNYFDTCFLVKLETNSEALIADIAQLEVFDNNIYIWDKSTDKLLSFDLQGNFRRTIGKKGRAPQEYTALAGFYINVWDNTINLFDPLNMSIKTYDTLGNYIKSVRHNNNNLCFVAKAALLDSNKVFCYHGSNWKNNNTYSIVDTKDYDHSIEIDRYPYFSSDYISYKFSNQPYIIRGDKVIYTKLFSNTLYVYENGQVKPYFKVKDKTEIAAKYLEERLKAANGDYYRVRRDLIKGNIYNTGFLNIFENERFILADFMTDNSILKALIWDKKRREGVCIEKYSTYHPNLQLFKSVTDNSIICLWDRSAILTFKEKLTEISISQYPLCVIEAVKNFDEDEDNPILIIFKFKENT